MKEPTDFENHGFVLLQSSIVVLVSHGNGSHRNVTANRLVSSLRKGTEPF
jgi:hypothetical protein